jgi:nucleoside-diphosphate-sugar epimerase
MRLLILGGTQFLGRAIATHACAAGHAVTCAARGISGTVPTVVRFVRIDRDAADGLAPLASETFDAVVDVSRHPGQVRRAVAALKHRAAHWTFVSTGSVYADIRTPRQRADAAPLKAATAPDVERGTEATYGNAKVACEQAVGTDAFICRAGLIVGPEDPTGRFTYWPVRLARGGEVLAPGAPDDLVQFVDVRDLAKWIVSCAEMGRIGCYDGVGVPLPRGEFLTTCARAIGADCTFTWVDQDFLKSQDVRRWAGPRSLPLWLPLPEFAGFLTRDATLAREAGLTTRSLENTARDTLAWHSGAHVPLTGLTTDEEAAVLKAWQARGTN